MLDYLKIKAIIELGKLTKKKQIERIPTNIDNYLIKKENKLWQITKVRKFVLQVGKLGIRDAKTVKAIIKNFPHKEILIYETDKILSNEDIKEIYNYHRNIIFDNTYMEKRNYNAKNEIFKCDINTYVLIIDKIEYLNKICLGKFEQEDERIFFIMTQLAKYIKYVDYHDYRTCMANAILLKSGVCIDFAITLYKCLNDLGYECELVNGISHGKKEYANSKIDIFNKTNHAWNKVRIKDKWYNVDLTWFAEKGDSKWLLSGDTDFEEGDRHITDQKEHLCRENYNIDRKNQLLEQMQKYESYLEKYDKGYR